MRSVSTAYYFICTCIVVCVCVSDTLVIPAKMTKPIELPFWGVDSDRPKET